jgi:hypothetical protein
MLSVDQFLTREDRDAIRAPIERARTFPQLAYYDPGFFALEVERIFSRNWIAVGFGSSLPAPGDRAPVEFCFMPGCPLSAKSRRYVPQVRGLFAHQPRKGTRPLIRG